MRRQTARALISVAAVSVGACSAPRTPPQRAPAPQAAAPVDTASATVVAPATQDPALGPDGLARRAHDRLRRDPMGLVVSLDEDLERSRVDAEQALQADPGAALASLTLAEVLEARDQVALALAHADRALALPGAHRASALLVRGRLRLRAGDPGALRDFDEALELAPADPRALTGKAAVLVAARDLAAAVALLDQAIALDPSLPDAYYQRALALLHARPREHLRATRDLTRALARRRGWGDAYFYRACAWSYASGWAQVLADLEAAERCRSARDGFAPHDLELLRGHAHFQREEWAEARAAYERYLRDAPAEGAPAREKVAARLRELEGR